MRSRFDFSGIWLKGAAAPLALLAGACATPTVAPPETSLPIPTDWAESDPAPMAVDLTEYWQLLGDPLITDLVEAALVHNRDLAQSAARLDQSRSVLVQARSARLPGL